MSVLDKLELTAGSERRAAYDPVQVRRRKLAASLLDQIKLIDAIEKGEAHTKTKVRRQIAQGTNEVITTHEARSASPWWTIDDDGSRLIRSSCSTTMVMSRGSLPASTRLTILPRFPV